MPSGDKVTLTYESTYNLPVLSAVGYTFNGWKITSNKGIYTDSALNANQNGSIVSNPTTQFFTEHNTQLTATAQWSGFRHIRQYSIKL